MSEGLWDDEQTPPERPAVEKPEKIRTVGGSVKSRRQPPKVRPVSDAESDETAEVVSEFIQFVRCASCGRTVRSEIAPMRHKAEAWIALSFEHEPDCHWIATRGYTDK